jgi:hypothetical protein
VRVVPSLQRTARRAELAVGFDDRLGLAGDEGNATRRAQLAHSLERGVVGVEVVAPVDQCHAARRRCAAVCRVRRRVHRASPPPTMTTRLPACACSVVACSKSCVSSVAVETVDLQPPRLERADAAGDDDRLGQETLCRPTVATSKRPSSRAVQRAAPAARGEIQR